MHQYCVGLGLTNTNCTVMVQSTEMNKLYSLLMKLLYSLVGGLTGEPTGSFQSHGISATRNRSWLSQSHHAHHWSPSILYVSWHMEAAGKHLLDE